MESSRMARIGVLDASKPASRLKLPPVKLRRCPRGARTSPVAAMARGENTSFISCSSQMLRRRLQAWLLRQESPACVESSQKSEVGLRKPGMGIRLQCCSCSCKCTGTQQVEYEGRELGRGAPRAH